MVDNSAYRIYHSCMFGIVRKSEVKKLQIQNAELLEKIETQEETFSRELQNLQAVLTTIRQNAFDEDTKYSWNRFDTYDAAIAEIHSMYNCESTWGCSIGSMIDLRAGLVGGNGIEVDLVDRDAGREKALAAELLKYNGFDSGGFLTFLQDCEKEGKALKVLGVDPDYVWEWKDGESIRKEKGMVRLTYKSYNEFKYEIIPDPENPKKAKGAKINETVIPAEKMVYRKFRGDSSDINKAVSIWQRCVEHICSLEKAYFDSRLNNHLTAAPKPIIECDNEEQARKINQQLNASGSGVNFKTRNILILGGGVFKYAVPAESANLENEIKEHRYAISFNTGIPVQFLGDPEAVKNKNVSENLMEGVSASVEIDRQIAEDIMNEALDKSIDLLNGVRTPYKKGAAKYKISDITAADWKRLIVFWMPAAEAGFVSRETLHEKTPGLDPALEKKRLDEEQAEKKEKDGAEQESFLNEMLSIDRAEKKEEDNKKQLFQKKEEK